MTQVIRTVFLVVLSGATLWHCTGCIGQQLQTQLQQMQDQATQLEETGNDLLVNVKGFANSLDGIGGVLVETIADQGVLDKFLASIIGNLQNPGMKLFESTERSWGIRSIGVAGRVDGSMSGTGTQLPKGLRDALVDQLDAPISDEQRATILAILGWNRIESPHNPPPPPGAGG